MGVAGSGAALKKPRRFKQGNYAWNFREIDNKNKRNRAPAMFTSTARYPMMQKKSIYRRRRLLVAHGPWANKLN